MTVMGDAGIPFFDLHTQSAARDVFFVSSATLREIALQDKDGLDILVYILFARGVVDERRFSTCDAGYLANLTGAPAVRLEKSLKKLAEAGIIALSTMPQVAQAAQEEQGKQGKKGKPVKPGKPSDKKQWQVNDGSLDIILPYALVDGSPCPILRLYEETDDADQSARQIDSLFVLVSLYRYSNMDDYGGVNPAVGVYRQWVEDIVPQNVAEINETPWSFYMIAGMTERHFAQAEDKLMGHVAGTEERVRRLEQALEQLEHHKYLYEVIQVWDINPLREPGKGRPLYTISVEDPHAQGTDPFLQQEIMRAAYRVGVTAAREVISREEGQGDMQVIYVSETHRQACLLGIVRLRYKSVSDMTLEIQRHDEWSVRLGQVHPLGGQE